MTRNTVLLILTLSAPGCCWWAKRSCFPECPPPRIVKVERPCELPPTLKLPAVTRVPCAPTNTAALVCLDKANAAKLALRESALKGWVQEARLRCETKGLTKPE